MSSSESEDENLKKFAASLDTTVFSDKLYNKSEEAAVQEPTVELKSQRYLEETENAFKSEINVSSTMQTFIGNKLSKLIEDQVEFVEMEENKKHRKRKAVDRVRLLSDSQEVVKFVDAPDFIETRKKVDIKRRKVDTEPETSEDDKLQSSVTDAVAISEEVKLWKKKPKNEPLEYKSSKDGVLHFKEPPNEFTKARNKNVWSEAKIKTTKLHSPPFCDLIKR